MKRRLFKLVVFLFLGMISTIAVSWSLAYWIDVEGWAWERNPGPPDIFLPFNDDWKSSDDYRHLWLSLEAQGISHTGMVELKEYRLPGVHLIILHAGDFRTTPELQPTPESLPLPLPIWCNDYLVSKLPSVVDKGYLSNITAQGVGWPLLALWCAPARADPLGSDEIYKSAVGGIVLETRPPTYWKSLRVRTMPLMPIWGGLVLNTGFYATILWLLWSCPFAVRRFIRSKRGRCIKCGYDLRGTEHNVCPECGNEVCAKAKA